MQQTTKYQLNKPAGTDTADIVPLNENTDKLEAALIALGVTPSTLALYGLPASAVPDQVLAAIKPAIDSKTKRVVGSYTGNNAATVNLNFGFKADTLLIIVRTGDSSREGFAIRPADFFTIFAGTNFAVSTITWSDTGASYTANSNNALNISGRTYYYIALGVG